MLSLHAAVVLGLCFFLPSLTLAAENPPQSVDVFWCWNDTGNSNPTDESIFSGQATVTWTRTKICMSNGQRANWQPSISGTPVTVKAKTRNGSKDFMDPASVVHWGHGRGSADIMMCDAHSRTDFTVHNGDQTQSMVIRLPDICTDKDCPGPDKERPDVQCLKGPKGKTVMYLGKWINPCLEP